jgi:hypothetical protein
MIYRAYYNKTEEYPFCWSIDNGTQQTEVNVMAVIILPPCVATTHCLDERPNDDSPVAWLEVSGELEIKNDIAYIS